MAATCKQCRLYKWPGRGGVKIKSDPQKKYENLKN
jgi:hypothetical protein